MYEDFHALMSRKRWRSRVHDYQSEERWRQLERISMRSLEVMEVDTAPIPKFRLWPPNVQVVKNLLIRRQYDCAFDSESLLGIIKYLSGLESISLETKPEILAGLQLRRDFREYLQSSKSLKTLSIFFDNQSLRTSEYDEHSPEPLVGDELAHDTCLLEHLAVSFATDAIEFFQDLAQREANGASLDQKLCTAADKKWQNLKSLVLTSTLLHPDFSDIMYGDVLLIAANAAAGMPSLRVMEIWNHKHQHDEDKEVACVFRYRRVGSDSCPTIYFSNTWGGRLPLGVVRRWRKVARMHEGRHLRVSEQSLDLKGLGSKSCGSLIEHLDLHRLVLQPVSRCQLMWEHEMRR
ncbi:hypothetical protein F5B17DRAFT_180354 [Nemania serpens]|nr:hypothetical protein F5B17DRAFT_180354 [Nemania serpens]